MIKPEYIDRVAMFGYLEAADIPVTRNERELIEAMPTLTDIGENYNRKTDKVRSLIRGIYNKNKYGADTQCNLYGRKRNVSSR